MKSVLLLTFIMLILVYCLPNSKPEFVLWDIDNLENIGGKKPAILGNPEIIVTRKGRALRFDGIDDAIILDANPIAGMDRFTIEIIFRPDEGGNEEQRFFHVQEADDHRVLIEIRLADGNKWYLDTFMKNGDSEQTLYAKDFTHTIGDWYHAALVYDGGLMRHYVNGVMELEGEIKYNPMANGQTSIGCRLNRIYWYKGAIMKVRISGEALSSDQFLKY